MRFVIAGLATFLAALLCACASEERPLPTEAAERSVVAGQKPSGEAQPTPGADPSLAPASGGNAQGSSLSAAPIANGMPPPPAQFAAVVIMDRDSGAVLYEVNPHLRLPPASLTKIATAVVALETLDPDKVLETNANPDQEWLDDATAMGLQPGDRFSVRELLYGMMLVSGNDAAKELARAAGGEAAFVTRMNALAHRLRLTDTHFTDVHGLGGPNHYSSANDLAVLAAHAMTLPVFRDVVGTETHTAVGSREIELYNFNPLLNYTPGVTGIKTGYTEEAGHTFVVSVERDGHGIIVVLLNAPNLAFDAIDLIEWTFTNHTWP